MKGVAVGGRAFVATHASTIFALGWTLLISPVMGRARVCDHSAFVYHCILIVKCKYPDKIQYGTVA